MVKQKINIVLEILKMLPIKKFRLGMTNNSNLHAILANSIFLTKLFSALKYQEI